MNSIKHVAEIAAFENSPEKKIFDELVNEIESQMSQVGIDSIEELADNESTEEFLKNLRLVVKYTPGLDFIGEGSSRYVYRLGSKYVLKVAKNYLGLIQNENEIKVNQLGSADYDCFVQILQYDPSKIFIVEDVCDSMSINEWESLIGIPLYRFVQILRIVEERRKTDKTYSVSNLLDECRKYDKDSFEMYGLFDPKDRTELDYDPDDYDGIISFMENIVDTAKGYSVSMLWKSLFDIFRFYFDNGAKHLVIGELPWPEQWGLCGEGPDRRIVLIDPGVNFDFVQQE